MIDFELSISDEEWVRELERVRISELQKVEALLEVTGREVVAYLRSLTGETRPAVRPGQPSRRAHPGHWADVTGILSNSYDFRVERDGEGVSLILLNSAEYAAELEVRDGYFVLKGVTDPGGPVEQALREVLPRIAPGWEVS